MLVPCLYCKEPVEYNNTTGICKECQAKKDKVMSNLPHDIKEQHPDWYEDTPAKLPESSVKSTLKVITDIAGK